MSSDGSSDDDTGVKKEEEDPTSSTTETQGSVMATAINLKPPSFISSSKSYEEYKREVKGWSLVTSVEIHWRDTL